MADWSTDASSKQEVLMKMGHFDAFKHLYLLVMKSVKNGGFRVSADWFLVYDANKPVISSAAERKNKTLRRPGRQKHFLKPLKNWFLKLLVRGGIFSAHEDELSKQNWVTTKKWHVWKQQFWRDGRRSETICGTPSDKRHANQFRRQPNKSPAADREPRSLGNIWQLISWLIRP